MILKKGVHLKLRNLFFFLLSGSLILGLFPIDVRAQAAPHFDCLRTDTNSKSSQTLPRPGYLESIIDPQFGSKITRVTGDAGTPIINGNGQSIGTWETACSHHYSKTNPWNADGTLLWIWKNCSGHYLLNGKTYVPIKKFSAGGNDRWHPTDPNLMMRASGNQFIYFNVHTGATVKSCTYSGYTGFSLKSEGNFSWDGKWAAPYAERTSDGHRVTFAMNIHSE